MIHLPLRAAVWSSCIPPPAAAAPWRRRVALGRRQIRLLAFVEQIEQKNRHVFAGTMLSRPKAAALALAGAGKAQLS
jgi:hypothetical protein